MRCSVAVCVGILLSSPVLADTALADTPLPPGKPAGVQAAVSRTGELYWFAGAAVVAAGLGLLMVGKKNGGISLNAIAVSTSP